jgi:hypothetical protein
LASRGPLERLGDGAAFVGRQFRLHRREVACECRLDQDGAGDVVG